MTRIPLPKAIEKLRKFHGPPAAPPSKDPWLLVLWENVAYLADDARRKAAFDTLKRRVGTRPEEVLAASDDALTEVTGHGILAETFAEKLRRCAQLALDEFDGDLRRALKLPLAQAKKALRRFPGFGEPGAEKVLLFARAHPQLALESNGLRVLVRLGFAAEKKSYSTTYRLVRAAVEPELEPGLKKDFDWLVAAHQLLRRHGQEVCKGTRPLCTACPLLADCPAGRAFTSIPGAARPASGRGS